MRGQKLSSFECTLGRGEVVLQHTVLYLPGVVWLVLVEMISSGDVRVEETKMIIISLKKV